MNEIFKQLSLQAGGSHYPTINPQLQQQFGELIVRECIDIVEDAVLHCEPASTYVGKIKQHFGIEQ